MLFRTDDDNINHEPLQWKAPEWQEEGRSVMNRERSCLLLCPALTGYLFVFDTQRKVSWKFPGTDPLVLYSPCMVALASGIVRFGNSRLNGQDGVYCSRVRLVDKHSLVFKRLLDLSGLQIQSLVPRQSP